MDNDNNYNEFDELDYNEYIYNKAEVINMINTKINNNLKQQQDKQQETETESETKINKPKAYKLSDYL